MDIKSPSRGAEQASRKTGSEGPEWVGGADGCQRGGRRAPEHLDPAPGAIVRGGETLSWEVSETQPPRSPCRKWAVSGTLLPLLPASGNRRPLPLPWSRGEGSARGEALARPGAPPAAPPRPWSQPDRGPRGLTQLLRPEPPAPGARRGTHPPALEHGPPTQSPSEPASTAPLDPAGIRCRLPSTILSLRGPADSPGKASRCPGGRSWPCCAAP